MLDPTIPRERERERERDRERERERERGLIGCRPTYIDVISVECDTAQLVAESHNAVSRGQRGKSRSRKRHTSVDNQSKYQVALCPSAFWGK